MSEEIEIIKISTLNEPHDELDAKYKEENIDTDINRLLYELCEHEAYVTDVNVDMWMCVEISIYGPNVKVPGLSKYKQLRVSCYRLQDALIEALKYLRIASSQK